MTSAAANYLWQSTLFTGFAALLATSGVTALTGPMVFGLTDAPAFEVASIKPSNPDARGSGIKTDTGRINARNVTLRRCLQGAYGLPEVQIVGGPKWLDENRYDIVATAAGPAGDEELMRMLQTLLADRFKVSLHRETQIQHGYALTVGKNGLKMKPSAPEARSQTSSNFRGGIIDAQACPMSQLALKLSGVLGAPVADLTQTPGAFDFSLKWTPDDMHASANKATDADAEPSLFVALQEQLGLKLEARKVPVEVLVIDHAELASEN